MLIGAMNHPQRSILDEIQWMVSLSSGPLDFIDLTLEPPAAASWLVDVAKVKAAIDQHHLKVVGHTAYYLPIASPFETLRAAAVAELRRCLEILAAVGAKWMNIHPDRRIPMHDRPFWVSQNLRSLRELLPASRALGVGLMIENLPEAYNTPDELAPFFDAIPELGLHLDIGHANLLVPTNSTPALLKAFGSRLRHVHLHDNRGGAADLHFPLGGGTLDLPAALKTLKGSGYDSTITLEVFTPDHHYLEYSRQVLRKLWAAA